jgi:predicted lipid-binding transport protein (Tim44 family)
MTSDSESRVTRSRRGLRRTTLLYLAVLAGVTVLRAQESPPTAAQPQPAAQQTSSTAESAAQQPASPASPNETPPSAAPTEGGQDVAADAEAEAPGKPDARPAGKVGPTRDRFEPSEKVRADFDVSFPVDI